MSEETLEIHDLQRFEPFENLNGDQLWVVYSNSERRIMRSGEVLFCAGDRDEHDYYLLEGTVQLVSPDNVIRVINDEDPQAMRQISKLRPRQYTVSAKGPVEVLVVYSEAREDSGAKAKSVELEVGGLSDYGVEEYTEPEKVAEVTLLELVQHALASNDLQLPSLPQVGLSIGKLVERDDVTAEAVARLVNTDPSIAAKLLRTANSSLYRGLEACDTTHDAIVRLGLEATRQLVLGFTLRDLFTSKRIALREKLRAQWIGSLEVAALAVAIRSLMVEPNCSVEEALLAGLMHDIGVVGILGMLDEHPHLIDHDLGLDGTFQQLKSEVGRQILLSWQFSDHYITVVGEVHNWQRQHSSPADLCDLIQVAKLHRMLNNREQLPMPSIGQSPALQRLPLTEVYSPQLSMHILELGRKHIMDIQAMFG
ncbi:MAG: HDOD domain-containing protein [Cellvibrionaceae bacterium]|nr:HDOD domain-containing protein [Cellvibrionaceae bacterium]MCV6627008.1 HDOD domain-containing protein [Cellvibrionaceae bacterium]